MRDVTLLSQDELFEAWPLLSSEDRVAGFTLLSRADAEELFDRLEARDHAELILALPAGEKRLWMRALAPDDAADVVQEVEDPEQQHQLLDLLDAPTRKEVDVLLAYEEDVAGGLMNPRFARLRPNMTADAAVSYLRRQSRAVAENIYYAYVLDAQQHLLGIVSFRELITAPPDKQVAELMETDLVTAQEGMDQEAVSHLFAEYDLLAIPVVDDQNRMRGIVTVDDIVDVLTEEATEDIQKFGGVEALDAPYLAVTLPQMLKKRAGWLALLLLLEFLTVAAMQRFEAQIATAAMLAFFVPLIVSCGGNSGSQASTLVVRAMALGELDASDWFRVIRRELLVGLGLGTTLATIGMLIVVLAWPLLVGGDRTFQLRVGATVAVSVLIVAMWGTVVGCTLPFLLRWMKFDPASASAPFVATIVDASGVTLYFTVAIMLLRGTVLQ